MIAVDKIYKFLNNYVSTSSEVVFLIHQTKKLTLVICYCAASLTS